MIDTTLLKQRLLEEQKTLYQELRDLGVQNQAVPEDWIATPGTPAETEADDDIVADRREDWIERQGEVAALETRYNNIGHALRLIEAGTYGTCEVCGKAIESDRLEANPAARTCKAHRDEEVNLPQ
jgi:RNA polymerase-binding transcription factor DksA